MKAATAILFCVASVAAAAEPPLFIEIPACRPGGEGVLCDIIAHSTEPPFGNKHGRPTNAHETAHGIHATWRNKHSKNGKRVNALYMGEGRVALVEEPEFLIRNIPPQIPQCLRGYRFPLYFVEQLRYWDDEPVYIFDEWTAYICGAECAVDDYQRCGTETHEDSVSGCLEFSVYAVALYLTAKARDPEHDPQLRAVLAYNLTRAEAAFTAGREVFRHSGQECIYAALQSHPDAQPIRACLRDEFGGAFLEGTP